MNLFARIPTEQATVKRVVVNLKNGHGEFHSNRPLNSGVIFQKGRTLRCKQTVYLTHTSKCLH